MTQKLYTTGHICDFTGGSRKSVLKLVEDKELRAVRLPGSHLLRFFAEDIVKFMRKHGYVLPSELKEKTK